MFYPILIANHLTIIDPTFSDFDTIPACRQKHTHTCRPVDGTSMNEECEAVMADHQVCAVRFLT